MAAALLMALDAKRRRRFVRVPAITVFFVTFFATLFMPLFATLLVPLFATVFSPIFATLLAFLVPIVIRVGVRTPRSRQERPT